MADDIDAAEEHLRKGHSPFHQVCTTYETPPVDGMEAYDM